MEMLLLAGAWLDSSIWVEVVAQLESLGHDPVAVPLPGQGDGNSSATLEDQIAAVVAAVDSAGGRPFVVGHSAACTLAWLAADARPEKVAKVAMIGGFPSSDGSTYADFFPLEDGAMAFPGWEAFEGPDSDDMDDAAKAKFAAAASPMPGGVALGTVRLTDDRRFSVPLVLVCPEFSPAEAKEWIEGGELPEVARVEHVSFVDIDSGHWPMITAPVELARLLSEIAGQS